FFVISVALTPLFAVWRTAFTVLNGLELGVYGLCGFMLPITQLPGWLQPVSYGLSPTWAARALSAEASPTRGSEAPPHWLIALYFALGNSLQLTANGGIFGVIATVSNERQYGTLPLLLGSPANRFVTFMSRSFVNVIDGMVSVVFGLIVTAILYGIDLKSANVPVLGLCILIISMTTAGLGLLFGSLGLVMRDSIIIANVVYYGLLIVCGINFPVSRLPGVLQAVSYGLPLTRGVQAARAAVAGSDIGHVAGLLAGELLIGALYAGLGYALFR